MRPSVAVPAIYETGVRRNRHGTYHPVIEKLGNLRVGDIIIENEHTDVEILRDSAHVSLCDSVQYDAVIVCRADDFRNRIVGGDGIFDAPELELESEVPVDGKTVDPDFDSVCLFFIAQNRKQPEETQGAGHGEE